MRPHPNPWIRFAPALALIAIGSFAGADGPPGPEPKVVIEFGWDEPDTAFLRKHITEMEQTPFDGCVFHAVAKSTDGRLDDLAWKAWGRRAFRKEELAHAFDDLEATRLTRFTNNLLRLNTTPADLDWFDDHAAILANARLAAELARVGKCLGVLLDTEQYQGPLFQYVRQRDAKTMLQEWAQGRGLPAPVYREVERTGPHHSPKFRVAVDISDKPPAEGQGSSKRAAEQAAAAAMLTREGVMMDADV